MTVCEVTTIDTVQSSVWITGTTRQCECSEQFEVERQGCGTDANLLKSETAMVLFTAFHGMVTFVYYDASIMSNIRSVVRITAILQYLGPRIAVYQNGEQEQFVLDNRYRALLLIDTENLQIEVI